jgi:membrane protease YdiL (CAAX protease family)
MTDIHIRPKWLLFTFFVLPGVSAVSCLIYWLTGGRLPQPQFELWFVLVAFAYILVLMGPLGEEAGWRGFALKRMLRYVSPIKSALLLGIIWSLWHLPLFFIEGTTQNALAAFGLLPAFSCYLLYTVMISVLITLLSVMDGGSILGSMLFHTMGNLSLGVMPLIFSKSGAVILLLVLSAATAGFTYKHRKIMFYKGEI